MLKNHDKNLINLIKKTCNKNEIQLILNQIINSIIPFLKNIIETEIKKRRKMTTNCFGFNLSRNKSKSVSKINSNKQDPNETAHGLSKSYGSDLNKLSEKQSFNNLKQTIPNKMLAVPDSEEKNLKMSISSVQFSTKDMKLFLNQNIEDIRSKDKLFEDKRFLCFVASIVENQESQLYVSLASRFKGKNLIELNNLIQWRRIKVKILPISYDS